MQKKRSPNTVDVVQIVRQVRRQIEEREARTETAGQVREQVREWMLLKLKQAALPEDVKADLLAAHLAWTFDPQTFWWSRRPGVGPVLNLFRRLMRPLVKLFFNPDAVLHHLHRLSYLVYFQQRLLEDLLVEKEVLNQPRGHTPSSRRSPGRRRGGRPRTRERSEG